MRLEYLSDDLRRERLGVSRSGSGADATLSGSHRHGTCQSLPEKKRDVVDQSAWNAVRLPAIAIALLAAPMGCARYPSSPECLPDCEKADLSGANLADADLTDADLSGAKLTRPFANLIGEAIGTASALASLSSASCPLCRW